ncbi:AAA family ATPase [Aureispira sp. CCB-E]|uniref:ATP-dependent DNA helicase n=1 Tax=Aureispira sp. CCB-E TaxID=3051121 RepID=UPI00286909BE|nr:AAA family ATPase [Aureispira sp. CCB-E]WMX16526.1 AAA family ATPase [Aureispira sp. CCB-E]
MAADFSKTLGFTPNTNQENALNRIVSFINSENDVFILKGSAGTGKTSIVKAITSYLTEKDINFQIGAPTGRAAMIIGEKTQQVSKTLHSQIYIPEKVENGGVRFDRKENKEKDLTIFLVDEASMVSDQISKSNNFFVTKPLLEEYIDFVKQGNPSNKIIFIGDRYQLPPVKQDFSPALKAKYLYDKYSLSCVEYELTKVMRQGAGSSILKTATSLRDLMSKGIMRGNVSIQREKYPSKALKKYLSVFDNNSIDKVIAICSSNKDVDYWNRWIRRELGIADRKLSVGDFVATQTSWLNKEGQFVCKGEYGRILNVDPSSEKYALLDFVNADIEFIGSSGSRKIVSTKILLDSLDTKYGILEEQQEKYLYAEAMKHNADFRTSQNPSDDKYIGALRLKHAYATTCHKAQGGEWENVLIHPWRLESNLQWAYTAITRAKENVYSYCA